MPELAGTPLDDDIVCIDALFEQLYGDVSDGLEEAVLAIARAELQRLLPAARAAAAAEALTMDAKLNDQGIAWWQQRHA